MSIIPPDFTFASPWAFALLVPVAVVALHLLWPRLRRSTTPTFQFSNAHKLADRHRGLKLYLRPVIDLFAVAAMILLVIALARPQIVEYDETDVDGIDIFVAFDMSGSMQAIDYDEGQVQAMDRRGESPPTRFDEAKDTLLEFVDSRPDDRIGIVLFAQEAVLQFPLTRDHRMIKERIERLEMGDIDEDGTAIGNALGRSLAGLEDSDADTQLVLLITDGDRRGGEVSPMQAAEMATQMGVTVYPILVGREGEALVEAGRHPLTGDASYRSVEFPIDPDLLQRMADTTGGEYFRAHDARQMSDDLHDILNAYDRSELEDRGRTIHHEHFAPFAIAALLLFSLQFAMRHTLLRQFP